METGLDRAFSAFLSESHAGVLTRWCESTRRGVRLASPERLRGHTEAWLAQVYVSGGDRTRKCLIKYDPNESNLGPEAGNHRDALALSPPQFTADHLVRILWDPIMLDDHTSLMFLEVANGDLAAVSNLYGLFGTRILSQALGTVVRSVLAEWNPDTDLVPTTAADLLREHLAGNLDPDDRLPTWWRRYPGLRESLWLRLPDGAGIVPNPLALLDGRLGDRVDVQKHVGRAHGDLHLGNVLVPQRPTGSDLRQFRLVDLAEFRVDAPLARDPMFLLASAALLYLPELGPRTRWATITALVDHDVRDAGLIPSDLQDCAYRVWRAGMDWAQGYGLGREWRMESLLSLVSAALQHMGFCATAEDRWWFFLLAAHAGTAFLVEAREPIGGPDRPGSTFGLSAVAAGAPEATTALARGNPPLAMADLRTLVDAIMTMAALHRPGAWARIADQLPAELVGPQPMTAEPREHVARVVTQLNRHRRTEPWVALLAAVAQEAPGDATLADAMDRVGLTGIPRPRRPS